MSLETRASLFVYAIIAGMALAFLGLLLKAIGIPGGRESRLYRTGDALYATAAPVMIGASVLALVTVGR